MKSLFINLSIILLLTFCSSYVNAQCPATVQLTQIPVNPVCKGTTVTYQVTPSAGSISAYFWVVNGDTLSTNSTISVSTNAAHVELYAVSDTCTLDTMFAETYIINTEIQAEYTVIVEECNQPVADIQIGSITGGQEPYTYSLITDQGDQGEQAIYSDVTVSTYPLVIEDANGCTDTTWINMSVIECPPPTPIDAFTPNEDGYNDTWFIRFIDLYPDNEVFIYDRWGQRVYHKKGYDNKDGWDAKYVGTDMPVSTYYYILKVNFKKQEEQVYNGAISIFR